MVTLQRRLNAARKAAEVALDTFLPQDTPQRALYSLAHSTVKWVLYGDESLRPQRLTPFVKRAVLEAVARGLEHSFWGKESSIPVDILHRRDSL